MINAQHPSRQQIIKQLKVVLLVNVAVLALCGWFHGLSFFFGAMAGAVGSWVFSLCLYGKHIRYVPVKRFMKGLYWGECAKWLATMLVWAAALQWSKLEGLSFLAGFICYQISLFTIAFKSATQERFA